MIICKVNSQSIIYGCSFGAKFMFLYSEKNLIFRETFSYLKEILLYSEKHFHIQRKFSIRWISLYFKKFLYSKKFYYVQLFFLLYSDKLFIFRKEFEFKETYYIQRKSCLCSEKMLIFRENVYIRENHESKFQIVWDIVVGFW